jgi:hypothetical protein
MTVQTAHPLSPPFATMDSGSGILSGTGTDSALLTRSPSGTNNDGDNSNSNTVRNIKPSIKDGEDTAINPDHMSDCAGSGPTTFSPRLASSALTQARTLRRFLLS